MIAKRMLAQVIILENFHLTKMEVQAILLEVSHTNKLCSMDGRWWG